LLGQTSGVSSPHQNKEGGGDLHNNTCPQTFYEAQPPRLPECSAIEFYLWAHLQTLVHRAPFQNEEEHHQCSFNDCKTFVTAPGPLRGCESP
jgi:hypothetical protein